MGGETLIMDTGVMSWHTISSPACESAASQVGKSVGGSGRVGVGGGKSGGSNSGNPPSPHDDRAPMQGTREARWEEGEEEREGGNCDWDWDIVSRQPGQPAPFSGLLQYARKQF